VDIENIGRRPHVRRLTSLRLTYDTPVAKVERAVEIVRTILANHDGMHPDLALHAYIAAGMLLIAACPGGTISNYYTFLTQVPILLRGILVFRLTGRVHKEPKATRWSKPVYQFGDITVMGKVNLDMDGPIDGAFGDLLTHDPAGGNLRHEF
jgi:hypothetical protein